MKYMLLKKSFQQDKYPTIEKLGTLLKKLDTLLYKSWVHFDMYPKGYKRWVQFTNILDNFSIMQDRLNCPEGYRGFDYRRDGNLYVLFPSVFHYTALRHSGWFTLRMH